MRTWSIFRVQYIRQNKIKKKQYMKELGDPEIFTTQNVSYIRQK